MRAWFIVTLAGFAWGALLVGGCPSFDPIVLGGTGGGQAGGSRGSAPVDGSAGSGGTGVCPGNVPPTFSVNNPNFGVPGCVGYAGQSLKAEAQIIDGKLQLDVEMEDGHTEFPDGTLELFIGSEPGCSALPATPQYSQDTKPNTTDQIFMLSLDTIEPPWHLGETKSFWVAFPYPGAPTSTTFPPIQVLKDCKPEVTSVKPEKAYLCQNTIFTITGQWLPDTTAYYIPQCAHITPYGDPSLTEVQFTCTPCTCSENGCQNTGLKDGGLVKDHPCVPDQSDQPMPTTLKTFLIDVEPPVGSGGGGGSCVCPIETVDPCK